MAVIANHPDSRFPRPSVTVHRHDYMPNLTGMGHDLAIEIQSISRQDPDRESGSPAYGHMRVLGGQIDAGILIAAVPTKHRITAAEETWLITYASGWVAAELHDCWASAEAVYSRHATRLPSAPLGALVVERQQYSLTADWSTNTLTWHRPDTFDPVPHAVTVWTDQLAEDPGIRAWAAVQSDPAPQICGLIAPEFMPDTLVGYTELARERGVTQAAMRNRVHYVRATPTMPDKGALWTRPAARALVTQDPPATHAWADLPPLAPSSPAKRQPHPKRRRLAA